MDSIIIRKITSFEELLLVSRLEKKIWGMEPVPAHQTLAIVKNGGLMLGAFLEEELIGFNYSFPGFDGVKYYLYSHMTGIHPGYRRLGIGFQLKKQQQMEARLLGFSLIKWTYDPLEGANAFFNLAKLRGVASAYMDNYYGDLNDSINSGLPTDRFELNWWAERQDRIELQLSDACEMCSIRYTEHTKYPVISQINTLSEWCGRSTILVPIPADFQKLKENDMQLAYDWRIKTRALFHSLFKEHYAGVHIFKKQETQLLNYYVFVPASTLS